MTACNYFSLSLSKGEGRVRVDLQLSIPHLNPLPSPRERRMESAEALLEFANPLWLRMILRDG